MGVLSSALLSSGPYSLSLSGTSSSVSAALVALSTLAATVASIAELSKRCSSGDSDAADDDAAAAAADADAAADIHSLKGSEWWWSQRSSGGVAIAHAFGAARLGGKFGEGAPERGWDVGCVRATLSVKKGGAWTRSSARRRCPREARRAPPTTRMREEAVVEEGDGGVGVYRRTLRVERFAAKSAAGSEDEGVVVSSLLTRRRHAVVAWGLAVGGAVALVLVLASPWRQHNPRLDHPLAALVLSLLAAHAIRTPIASRSAAQWFRESHATEPLPSVPPSTLSLAARISLPRVALVLGSRLLDAELLPPTINALTLAVMVSLVPLVLNSCKAAFSHNLLQDEATAERVRLIPSLGLQLESSDAAPVFVAAPALDALIINEAFEHCRVATYLALRLADGSHVVVFNRTRPRFRSLAVAYRALSPNIKPPHQF